MEEGDKVNAEERQIALRLIEKMKSDMEAAEKLGIKDQTEYKCIIVNEESDKYCDAL